MADSIDISGRRGGAQQPARPAAAVQVSDPMADGIKPLFTLFLNTYVLPSPGSQLPTSARPSQSSGGASLVPVCVRAAAEMKANESTTMYIDYTHIAHFHPQLTDAVREHFYRLSPHLNGVLHQFMSEQQPDHSRHKLSLTNHLDAAPFRVAFFNLPVVSSIRELKTSRIGELMSISGTVTRTSAVRPELSLGSFRCADCKTMHAQIAQQFKYTEPNHCLNSVCENRQRWFLDTSMSTFSDWQLVRIQENSHEIPAGSMPRSMKIVLRHDVVELAKPGDKCVFTGTLIVVPDITQLGGGARFSKGGGGGNGRRTQDSGTGGVMGLKELGVRDLTYSLCFLAHSVRTSHSAFGSVAMQADANVRLDADGTPVEDTDESFTDAEKDRVQEMKAQGKLYTRLVASIAPNIFGHDEIKRGILLMLFGGVHKRTSDGQNLRGDINVCIVGDPSTSKSQFLKYVCTFLPRAVYTSGKASSAAGLTASIARDPETGEFAIEAGALMLADNGICCIDEFDKMEPTDQVAIHEAMEQQTISIAKAGIQATLNARTSILAAANPIKGRYDPSRTLKQNVDISAPIMSRFDLFFVVLDEGDQAIDYNIARHIVNVHTGKASYNRPEFSLEDLQLYIRYARTRKPAISPAAKQFFVDNYCSLRGADSTGTNKSAYRITVRQLESMIRLAEARARLDLENVVTPSHVKEAARLLKKSIVHVENRDVDLQDDEDELANYAADEEEGDVDMTNGGGRPGDDDDDQDGGAAPGSGRGGDKRSEPRSPAQRGSASQSRAEGKEDEATGDAAAAAASAAAKKEVKLSFNEYQRITLLLVHFMRSRETPSNPTTSWKDLVNYYISESLSGGAAAGDAGAPQSEAELLERTKTVELVIHRLIKTDHILLLLRKSADKAKRMLQVHPNFTGESEALAIGNARVASQRANEDPAGGSADADLLAASKEHADRRADDDEQEQKEDAPQPMDEGEDEPAPVTPVSAGSGVAKGRARPARTPTSGRSARSNK